VIFSPDVVSPCFQAIDVDEILDASIKQQDKPAGLKNEILKMKKDA